MKHSQKFAAKKKCYSNPLKRPKEPVLYRMNSQLPVLLNTKKCILLPTNDPAVDTEQDAQRDAHDKSNSEEPKKGIDDDLSPLGPGMAKEERNNDRQKKDSDARSCIFDPGGDGFPAHEIYYSSL
jgi:hypothetical protein